MNGTSPRSPRITQYGGIPVVGSLRSWLWVRFLCDTPPHVWASEVSKAGRGDDATLLKLVAWWTRWTDNYPQLVGSQRAGRLVRQRTQQLRRNFKNTAAGFAGLATRWR